MTERLDTDALAGVDWAAKPGYDRNLVTPGILHLGIGGFHRAHQAVYTDEVLAHGHLAWGITGASLRSSTVRDQLVPQDGLYTVCTRGPAGDDYRIIGSVLDVLTLADARDTLVALIASPATRVVTLTITEKGYCLAPDGAPDLDHDDLARDLEGHPVITAPGLIVAGLRARRLGQGAPLSVVSCDNLSRNGARTRDLILAAADVMDPGHRAWYENEVSFPSTMVDRIVPATTEDDRAGFLDAHGLRDEGLTLAEPFSQWVIENDFRGERPPWDLGGAVFSDDVELFETAKLRLLNAAHSALAYLGLVLGFATIHEAMADDGLRGFVRRVMTREIAPVLRVPSGMDITAYIDSILVRFDNHRIAYATAQVAGDGSQKMRQRIYPTLLAHRQQGTLPEGLVLVTAAWLHCATDPELRQRFVDPGAPAAGTPVPELLSSQLAPAGLAGDPGLDAGIREALAVFRETPGQIRGLMTVT